MHRRRFLSLSALASAALLSRNLFAQQSARNDEAPAIPADFTGLSYESRQLGDPDFFSADNKQLITLVSLLGKRGVLRIGGNTSEYCFFDRNAKPAKQPIVADPDKGRTAPPNTTITRAAIRNLRAFLDATNWTLVYGLNLGKGTPDSAADEAAFVHDTIGPRLTAFQIGNEPDLFPQNGLRPKDWSVEQFLTQWKAFHDAIRKHVPNAVFWGPADSWKIDWTTAFAERFHSDVAILAHHYYAEGPPTDPAMTIDRLLHPNASFERVLDQLQYLRRDLRLPYRIAETNSCYSGGKQGVSDTFASALWGADLMFELAARSAAGINLHGGGNGWYTPIAGTLASGFSARPIYYGMLLFAAAGAGTIRNISNGDALSSAYLVTNGDSTRRIFINKHASERWTSRLEPGTATHAEVLLLTAPSLESTSGVTLGGAAVTLADGRAVWNAQPQILSLKKGGFNIDVPPASALMVTVRK